MLQTEDEVLGQVVSQWLKKNPSAGIVYDIPDSVSSKHFEDAIIEGKWDEIIADLEAITVFEDEDSRNKIKSVIFELTVQKIQEKIAEGNQIEALRILRNELTPLGLFSSRIHELTQDILLNKTERMIDKNEVVKMVLKDLKGLFYSDNRLEELIGQAREYQMMTCPYHCSELEAINDGLWRDHKCRVNRPRVLKVPKLDMLGYHDLNDLKILMLSPSKDFSNLLMVARLGDRERENLFIFDLSKDRKLKIYDEDTRKACDYSIWPRHDYHMMLLAYNTLMVKLGNELDGKIVALAQMPDENLIIHSTESQITTLFDKKNSQVLHSWIRLRCSYLLTPADVTDRYFLAVTDDGRILQISTESYAIMKTLPSVDERHAVSSAYLDGKRLLIGFANSTLYYYEDWQSYEHPTRIFRGHYCINHRTSAILPSSNTNLALACSENGSVYGWNLQTGRLIYEIKVHEGCVTDIFDIGLEEFVTSGEDGKVYLWRIQ